MKKMIAGLTALAALLAAPGPQAYAAVAEVVSPAAFSGGVAAPMAPPVAAGALPGLPQAAALSAPASLGLPRSAAAAPSAFGAPSSAPSVPAAARAFAPGASAASADAAAAPTAAATDAAAVPAAAPDSSAARIGAAPAPASEAQAPAAAQAASAAPDPAAGRALFDGAPTRPAILLVGTSGSRPFILTEAKRVAEELGYDLMLLDNPAARAASQELVPDSHFIPAAIDDHRASAASEIVDRVAEIAKSRPLAAVISFLNPYAQIAGDIVDRTGAKGLSGRAIEIAHTKSLAREAMASVPEIATPYRIVRTADEARQFFREQGGAKIVLKPIKGGGSQGVVTDVASEKEAGEVFDRIDADLKEFMKRPDAGFFNLDQHPGIMAERQLSGPEVDVELIVQGGEVKFWHVSDNAPMDRPYAIEKNSTYSSVLSPEIQKQLVDAAGKAGRAMGLQDGNLHVELMMTPDGPRVLEVNARMGGAFVWEFIRDQTGVSMIEQGIRAALGLPVDPGVRPTTTLEARFMIPMATGRIESIEGLDALEKLPGFVRSRMLHKAGDEIKAAPDDAFDYFGYVGFRGKDYAETMERMLTALDSVKIKIRKADGTLVEQTGAYAHSAVDTNAMLAPEQRPGLRPGETYADSLARRDRIMRGYLRGQLALIASFAMYYSLFSPVATALAGVGGMGSGRSAYAGSVAIVRPLAGVLVERFSARTVLIAGFAARAAIWAAILPTAFAFLGAGAPFLATFVGLMVVDGAIVSINGLVDIDEGGIDLLGKQHAFPVDDALRNKYNTLLDGFYSASRVIVAPAMAALGVVAAGIMSSAAGALVAVMAVSFAVPASVALYYYARYIPARADMGPVAARRPAAEEAREIASKLWEGFKLAWSNKNIRWRILLNSAERAIEDSMLFVVLAEFAMRILAKGNPVYGALYTAGLIAFGKIGAMVSAYLMHGRWKAPVGGEAKYPRYRPFFGLAAGGTLATLLMPAAAFAAAGVAGFPWLAAALAGASALAFNLMFSASALGFRNLMQGIVSEQNASGRLFGIQGTILMAVNALAILGLSAIFAAFGLGAALSITTAIYAAYGVFQAFVGPRLLFTEQERKTARP
jgi:biotin carboxylase